MRLPKPEVGFGSRVEPNACCNYNLQKLVSEWFLCIYKKGYFFLYRLSSTHRQNSAVTRWRCVSDVRNVIIILTLFNHK